MISDIVKAAIAAVWMSYDPETMRRGRDILEEAAAEGDADAMCFFGRTFLGPQYVWSGAGFPENDDKGLEYLRMSALKGSAAGVLCCMRTGIYNDEIEKEMPFGSVAEVFAAVRDEADAGEPFCQYLFANIFFWGDYLLVFPSAQETFKKIEDYYTFAYPFAAAYFERSFLSGLSAGFGNYRTIYRSGCFEIPEERYEFFLKKLALAGSPECCAEYGQYIEDHYEGAEKEKEAYAFYKMAYEKGEKDAPFLLGTCYARGYGIEYDLDKAFELYKEAAELGDVDGRFHVGNFYFEGRGNVTQNYREALKWLRKAYGPSANWKAGAEMGLIYFNGLDVPRDPAIGFRYLHALETTGHVDDLWEPLHAMVLCALGRAYAFGDGTKQDVAKGKEYLDRAIQEGSEEARAYRDELSDE